MAITKIRSDADAVENVRRIQEEKQREERFNAIQTEVHLSYKKNIGIDLTWQDLEDKEDCEELAAEIEKQKEACKAIIDSKDTLIKQFMEQLKQKDDEYVKALKKQGEDIEKLIEAMRKQFFEMRLQYARELNEIEGAFRKEREEILEQNDAEIKALFDEHKRLEEHYLMERQQNEEDYAQQLEDLRSREANDQAEQKIKLETEMQILEKCMEDMKAVYKLNEEKLDFNLRVLGEREKVNSQAMTTLKKKVQRQKENYRIITKRYYKENQEFKKTNAELTQEYKRITRQFKELQLKFKKFEKSDESRFNEIWSMNEQEVRALINKIIQADRVIHVQQLGIPWTPPSDALFGFTEGGQGGSQLNPNTSVVDSSKHGLSKSEFIDDQSVGSAAQGYECKVSIKKIKNVFKKLIEEVPFLIDDKVLQECEGKNKKEQFTLKIDGIRKSLDIDNMEDVELLVQTFYDFSARHKAEVTMEGMHSRAEGEAPEEDKAAPA